MEGRVIPEEIVSLVGVGTAGYIATANADRMPEATRICGARVADSRRTLTVYVPRAPAVRTFENLRHDPRIACFIGRVSDFHSVQFKGEVVAMRPSTDEERQFQARHMRAFIAAVAAIGGPASLLERHAFSPSEAVEIRVDEMFEQTPGPGAGRRWP